MKNEFLTIDNKSLADNFKKQIYFLLKPLNDLIFLTQINTYFLNHEK